MIREELQRLLFKPKKDEECNLMQIEVQCDGNAHKVLERAKEALVMILSVESLCEDYDSWETDASYKFLAEWFESNMFIHINAPDVSRDTDKVGYFSEERDWFWWDGRVVDDNILHVYILLEGFPVSGFDDLRWLLQCSGASSVEQGEQVQASDIHNYL
jgi:hypothetical protein